MEYGADPTKRVLGQFSPISLQFVALTEIGGNRQNQPARCVHMTVTLPDVTTRGPGLGELRNERWPWGNPARLRYPPKPQLLPPSVKQGI